MARGKQTCKILKEIRRQIAEVNDIEFVTSECRYKGDCLGTCPKCEAEVRYLEQQLRSRQRMGKTIAIAGISAGMIALSGCGNGENKSANNNSETLQGEPMEMVDTSDFEGEVDEEYLLSKINDTVSQPVTNISGIKEGEIANDPKLVVTQGEIPMDSPKNPDDKGIYQCVEQKPEFPGGNTAMMKFIADNLRYPKDQCVQGRVIVNFYVDTLGHVCEPKIFRGLDPAFDQEALRVVKLFPDFTPGRLNGKKVNVRMIIPVSFKLESD